MPGLHSNGIRRRPILTAAGGFAATLAWPDGTARPARAQANIVIAGTKSVTGEHAVIGQYGELGSALALRTAALVGGHSLDYWLIDTGGPAAQVLDKVRDTIEKSAVRFFTGAASPETGPLIADRVEQAGCVYACGLGVDELAGAPCHRSVFRWSSAPQTAIEHTVGPLLALLPRAERWYLIAPETPLGHSLLTATQEHLTALAVEQVGTARVNAQDRKFSGLVARILVVSRDVV